MKYLIYVDFENLEADSYQVEDEAKLSTPCSFYALDLNHGDPKRDRNKKGVGNATMRIFNSKDEKAKIEHNGWSIAPVFDYSYDYSKDSCQLNVQDPEGSSFVVEKKIDTTKNSKDKHTCLAPFLLLKELQAYSSKTEYELKTENERLKTENERLEKKTEGLEKDC